MHILKKIVRGLCAYGFRAALFAFAFFLSLVLTLQSPHTIKSAVANSGLYDIPIHKLVDFEGKPEAVQENASEVEISIEDPTVQNALAKALPEERKQQIVESIIDGTYTWLHGDAEQPDFTVDLNGEKQKFVTYLADDLFIKIDGYEPCSLQELSNLGEIDPFKLTCRPPVDLATEKQRFINELSSSEDFLPDPVFSGDELLDESKRHDSVNAIDTVPQAFGIFTKLPQSMLILALVSGLGVVLLADNRRTGIKKLGKLLIETAISLLITGAVLYFILGGLRASLESQATPELGTALMHLFESLRWEIIKPGLIMVGIYTVFGGGLIFFTREKVSNREEGDTNNQEDRGRHHMELKSRSDDETHN